MSGASKYAGPFKTQNTIGPNLGGEMSDNEKSNIEVAFGKPTLADEEYIWRGELPPAGKDYAPTLTLTGNDVMSAYFKTSGGTLQPMTNERADAIAAALNTLAPKDNAAPQRVGDGSEMPSASVQAGLDTQRSNAVTDHFAEAPEINRPLLSTNQAKDNAAPHLPVQPQVVGERQKFDSQQITPGGTQSQVDNAAPAAPDWFPEQRSLTPQEQEALGKVYKKLYRPVADAALERGEGQRVPAIVQAWYEEHGGSEISAHMAETDPFKLTELLATLQRRLEQAEGLVGKWREPSGDSNESHRKQRYMCATELEAALRDPAPAISVHFGKPTPADEEHIWQGKLPPARPQVSGSTGAAKDGDAT